MEFKHAILEYWTLVEFFSPYLLETVLNPDKYYERVYADQPCSFPWWEQKPLNEDDKSSIYEKGYHLYLGIFSTKETADRARHVFTDQPSDWQSVDWRQCGSQATLSCFARLGVTKFGTPILGTLSLSTLPWAHGRLLNHEMTFLTMENYWKTVQRLLKDLEEKFIRTLPKRVVRLSNEMVGVLDHKTLCQLVEFLFRWAGFTPSDYPIALIETLENEEIRTIKEESSSSKCNVPILNSFYIQDLERAAVSFSSEKGTPLDLYLNRNNKERILLEGESGKKAILDALKPSKHPKGRWPIAKSKNQTLMQQFAINQTKSSLVSGGIFSVNGPPGTGKTTMLREIIADNIVARGAALAKFKHSKAAFTGTRAMGFDGEDPVYVSNLHPSLVGYEMVVVSSNNTAVQNLSHELPLSQQLDPDYAYASYLEPVACRLLDLEKNKVWGLISAALGNVENCRRLVDRVFISRDGTLKGERIWDWAKKYSGPSFTQARDWFLSLQDQYEELIDSLDELAYLLGEIDLQGSLHEKGLKDLHDAEKTAETWEVELAQLQHAEEEIKELLDLLEKQVELWNQQRPNIWQQLGQSQSWSEWSLKSREYSLKQIATLEKLHISKERLHKKQKEIKELQSDIEAKEIELLIGTFWRDFCKDSYEKLKSAHLDLNIPDGSFDDPESQKQGFYQTATLNHIRTELFIAAMALHEAWLAEILQPKGGFRGNLMAISNLLQGKNPTTANDTLLAWQCVFLLIPLLSSTFASIARLFRYLEPKSLGWVFIDEAGQALPQAAVGAIWRAQRVLSIGDPFQIEPISTVPSEIVDGMAKVRLEDHRLSWAPSQVSVQHLMDAATKYGKIRHLGEVPFWLGSPLRVHRRCIEPMFSIANEIAYENSMVLATTPLTYSSLPKSCWYDISGAVSDRQYVSAQGTALTFRLFDLLKMMSAPDVYVISPFREVVRQLKQLILREKGLKELFEAKFPLSLHLWVREAVGTVHSFQGKQAAAVFFVLGGDQTTLGSLEWATRKPNLLNVAVTRACQRFYIIGDYNLWHRWPYFDVAAKKLERI